MNEQFERIFRDAAREFGGIDPESVGLDQPIEDLGLDSIAMFEVVGRLEEGLKIRLPDERLAEIRTLRDLSDLVDEVQSTA